MTEDPGAQPPRGRGSAPRVEELVGEGDFSWVSSLLGEHRDEILDRWLAKAAAQPFHAGRRARAVADHIPSLFDALAALLHRVPPRGPHAGEPLEDAAVLEAAQAHARDRFRQGLTATEVLTEFRLLRQEIGRALRLHLADTTPTGAVVSAEILVHDALDGAALLALAGLGEQDAARHRAEAAARRARAELEAERGLLDALFRTAPVGFALLDRELRYVRINDRLAEINGQPVAAHLGRTGREMVPAIADQADPPVRRVLETGEPMLDVPMSAELPSRPGEVRHWRVNHYPVRDPSGEVVGVGVVAIETTAQVQAEAALRESEERFRTLADNISQLAWMADPSGWIFWYNRRWFDYTGTTLEEMQGWGWTQVHHPEHIDRVVTRIQHAWDTGEPWEDTFPLRGKDGQFRWFLSRAVPIRAADGRVVRWFGTNTDITDLRHAEEAQHILAEASRVFAEAGLEPQSALESITRYVAEVLGDGAIAFLATQDGQRLELHGVYHSDPEAVARIRAAVVGSPRPPDQALVGQVLRTGEPVLVHDLTGEDADGLATGPGYVVPWHAFGIHTLLIAPLRARGRAIGTLSVWRDQDPAPYTSREQQLLQDLSDRAGLAIDNARLFGQTRAAVRLRDEVLGAVSHDLQGPLAAIKGTAQVLRRRVATRGGVPGDALLEALERIDGAATRMSTWIEELVDVAQMEAGRELSLHLASVDLVELASQAVAEHQQTTPGHAIHFEAAVPRLIGWFDPARLRRVLDNLLSNAVKYSPAGQPITVRVDRQADTSGAWARLDVQDNGVGIPAADVPHIFERFHRARNVVGRVRGTGIGLAGARQIVEQHGGRIELKTQEGQGSTFTVRLPLAPAESEPVEQPH